MANREQSSSLVICDQSHGGVKLCPETLSYPSTFGGLDMLVPRSDSRARER